MNMPTRENQDIVETRLNPHLNYQCLIDRELRDLAIYPYQRTQIRDLIVSSCKAIIARIMNG